MLLIIIFYKNNYDYYIFNIIKMYDYLLRIITINQVVLTEGICIQC